MFYKHKNVVGLIFSVFFFLVIFNVISNRVSAATITVGGACTLPAAIVNSNANDQSGSASCTAGSGTDTINIPAGTITLSTDLPAFTESVTVSGASKSTTTINGNGNLVFNADFGNQPPSNTQDVTIEKMSIVGASPHAVHITKAQSVVLDNLDISTSSQAIYIELCTNTTLSNSKIHDNDDPTIGQPHHVGIRITPASTVQGGTTSTTITDSKIINNSGNSVGVDYRPVETLIGNSNQRVGQINFTARNLEISSNTGEYTAGMIIVEDFGPLSGIAVNLDMSATTIANNSVTVAQAVAPVGNYLPIISGFFFTGKLGATQQSRNVTVAYNRIINNLDSRQAFAGFGLSMADSGTDLDIINTTVVGNSVTQANSTIQTPAFFAAKATLDQSYQVTNVVNGSTAKNVMVAQNKFNGTARNCWNAADLSIYGLSGTFDATPANLGNNLSDDQTCTGYTYSANLYDTIEHVVKDNGGPVSTIALLPGSPAINGGSQVLGITTDARGVARVGYYSVGAYQGVLAASTTNPGLAGTLAETGAVTISAGILLGIFLISFGLIYFDYRRHKKPLRAADPTVKYSLMHHMKVVTIPLCRYRISISISKVNPLSKEGMHKF